jgi:hypothetical protein
MSESKAQPIAMSVMIERKFIITDVDTFRAFVRKETRDHLDEDATLEDCLAVVGDYDNEHAFDPEDKVAHEHGCYIDESNSIDVARADDGGFWYIRRRISDLDDLAKLDLRLREVERRQRASDKG